ncbi:DUF1236 domain-containing protein [Rhodoplanes elegans]|nr:DUF1236 domain-containing protein [Rhodoplanes elegans]
MDDPTRQDRRGTRQLMMAAAALAIVLGIGVIVWMVLPGYDRHQSSRDATGPRFNQDAGTSTVGRSPAPPDAAAAPPDDIAVGRNQGISATAQNRVDVTPEQQQALQTFAQANAGQRVDQVAFTVAVGVAVPRQVGLQDMTAELAAAFPEYRDAQYLLMPGKVVVVERETRRVVAILPTTA